MTKMELMEAAQSRTTPKDKKIAYALEFFSDVEAKSADEIAKFVGLSGKEAIAQLRWALKTRNDVQLTTDGKYRQEVK